MNVTMSVHFGLVDDNDIVMEETVEEENAENEILEEDEVEEVSAAEQHQKE